MSDIWDRITFEKTGGARACWEVTSHATNSYGYPIIKVDGTQRYIHRLVFEAEFGSLGEGMVVRHLCDNRLCCKPTHLTYGTHADNVRDRVERGRSATGTQNGRSKLTEEKVQYVLMSDETDYALGKTLGVDPKTIRAIRDGRTWTHVQI